MNVVRRLTSVRRRGVFNARVEAARPGAVTVGTRTYAARTTLFKTFAASEQIAVGAWCSIAGEVRILHPGVSEDLTDATGAPVRLRLRGNHRMDTATTYPIGIVMPAASFDELPRDGSVRSRPLVIGNDVWIGYRATVLGSITIGDGAIIGAGAVVASDVPPYAIVAGNPARILRYRFAPETIEGLLRIAWWDWPEALVLERAEWFLRPVDEFVAEFDPIRPK